MLDLNHLHALLHFGQLPAATQLAHFYTCTLTPVSPGMHQAAITLDEEHGYRISNPAYQLFCALVLQDFELMNLADAVLDNPRLHGLIDAHRFPPALKREVVRELAWHTSHRGFVEGAHWQVRRAQVAEDYRHDRLRHPVAGFGRSD